MPWPGQFMWAWLLRLATHPNRLHLVFNPVSLLARRLRILFQLTSADTSSFCIGMAQDPDDFPVARLRSVVFQVLVSALPT